MGIKNHNLKRILNMDDGDKEYQVYFNSDGTVCVEFGGEMTEFIRRKTRFVKSCIKTERKKTMKFKKVILESECLEALNEALKGYCDSDFDSDGVIYIAVDTESAKTLFEKIFEGSFEDYNIEFGDDGECDICPMWGAMDISGDVVFSRKELRIYRDI